MSLAHRFAIFLAFALTLAPSYATAGLGEHERSVEADRIALKGDKTVISGSAYTIYEIHTGASQTVREYATPNGSVFAITWRGGRQPDLEQLFGTYHREFIEAEQSTPSPGIHGLKRIDTPNITVFKYGHMGDVRGKAFIPNFMPEGVSARDLK